MNKKREFNNIAVQTDRELANHEKNGIKYIQKKDFKKAVDEGLEYRIVGRTRLISEKTDSENKDFLKNGEQKFLVDKYKNRLVKGYIPVGEARYLEYVGVWLPVFWILGGVVLAGIIGGLIFQNLHKEDDTPFTPNDTIETIASSDDEETPDYYLTIALPDGTGTYEGTVLDQDAETTGSETGTPYTGQTHLTVNMNVDGEEHLLADYDAEIENGQIPDYELDFSVLNFELLQGTYDGTIDITYPDGTMAEKSIGITVRQINGGQMAVSYSPDVTIDLASNTISCHYSADSTDTHETTIQLVLLNNDQEYILSESGAIEPGEALTAMTLDESMKSRLTAGVYDGYMRLTFTSDSDDSPAAGINTDIEVTITVQ